MVGDDDQSIYGWRGADVRKILGFDRDFPGAKVVRLETNYRSTRPILNAANTVIRRNSSRHEKALESARGHGEPVRVVRLKDEITEASFVVDEMRKLLRLEEAVPKDFAILCRTQVQSGRSRSSCARTACPTRWSAACRSSTARRCAT